ncbi:MAG TPA: hypothetical protein VK771_05970, partial [Acidimicrobiia bacterium]|nr:hypothetical protein [Acidimicrobiia bacterium]
MRPVDNSRDPTPTLLAFVSTSVYCRERSGYVWPGAQSNGRIMDVRKTVTDAGYIAIGLGVMGYQQTQT